MKPRGRSANRGPARRAAAIAAFVVCAAVQARAEARPEPRRPQVDEVRVEGALGATPAACRDAVAAALRAGLAGVGGDCAAHFWRVTERLIAEARPRPVFGIVERTTVRLARVVLVLSEAHHCQRWPLREPRQPALDAGAAFAAGCRVRRYHGPLAIAVVDPEGRERSLLAARTDADGRVEISLADLDARLRAGGRPGLSSHAELVLGDQGWAGRIDLKQLRAQLADWHLEWIKRGRGSPALFSALHPEHPGAAAMRTLALEATVQRHEADVRAVERGELSPRAFLERHAWSPFRSLVRAMLQGQDREDMSEAAETTEGAAP